MFFLPFRYAPTFIPRLSITSTKSLRSYHSVFQTYYCAIHHVFLHHKAHLHPPVCYILDKLEWTRLDEVRTCKNVFMLQKCFFYGCSGKHKVQWNKSWHRFSCHLILRRSYIAFISSHLHYTIHINSINSMASLQLSALSLSQGLRLAQTVTSFHKLMLFILAHSFHHVLCVYFIYWPQCILLPTCCICYTFNIYICGSPFTQLHGSIKVI